MLRVRVEERPSLSAFDAFVATRLLVTRFDELLTMRLYLHSHPRAMYAGVFALTSEDDQCPSIDLEGHIGFDQHAHGYRRTGVDATGRPLSCEREHPLAFASKRQWQERVDDLPIS